MGICCVLQIVRHLKEKGQRKKDVEMPPCSWSMCSLMWLSARAAAVTPTCQRVGQYNSVQTQEKEFCCFLDTPAV